MLYNKYLQKIDCGCFGVNEYDDLRDRLVGLMMVVGGISNISLCVVGALLLLGMFLLAFG